MSLVGCHNCCRVSPAALARCPRCGAALHMRKQDSLQRTVSLLVTAAVLYVPANVYPIMHTDHLGTSDASTILGGVVLLLHHGSAPIAAVIFVASVIVPIGKLLAISYLAYSVSRGSALKQPERARLYRITEFIGKWSMVDVFVVSILVALVQVGDIVMIRPGVAALAFAGVVIVTMIAAESFDSRLIWDLPVRQNASEEKDAST